MLHAFLYLTVTSARNRLRLQLQRLRNPRYLAALVLALAYLGLVFGPAWRADRPATVLLEEVVLIGISLGALLLLAWWWLFGTDRGALAFSPAEVQFLFPAPATRRQLIQFKLIRAQLVILVNIVIWSIILGRGRGAGELMWVRPLSLWILLSTVQLHRLGATLARTNLTTHGMAGLRRSGVAGVVIATLLGAVAIAVMQVWPDGGISGPEHGVSVLRAVGEHPMATWALMPIRAVFAPLFATTWEEWSYSIVPATLIMLVHFLWVVRSDAAFEEAAVDVSAERAQRISARQRGFSAPRSRGSFGIRQWIPLAPEGEPAVAIFWKNVHAAIRGDRFFRQTFFFGIASVVVAFAAFLRPERMTGLATGVLTAWGVMLVLLGPLWLRNDLRADLTRLSVLRTYPVHPPRLVAAEIASSAIVLSFLELFLVVALFIAQLRNPEVTLGVDSRIAIAIAVALALPALNLLGSAIHNAATLLFPAWLPLGADRKQGIEAMGQVYLTMAVTIVLLAVLLILPTIAGGVAYLLLTGTYGHWAAVPAVAVGSAVAGGELLVMVRWLGGVFDRLEPSALEVTA